MASWAFVAALSWLTTATIGLVVSLIALLTLVAVEFAAVVALLGALVPFVLARSILSGSAMGGSFAAVFAFGLATYTMTEIGPTTAMLALLWLGFTSAMAGRAGRKSHSAGRSS